MRLSAKALGLLFAFSVAYPGVTAAQDPLESYLASFDAVGPVHVVATARIKRQFANGTSVTGGGEYQYWDDGGDRYRMKCSTGPDIGLMADSDVSFDGVQFRMHIENLMEVSSVNATQMVDAIPNPLFLPIAFLTPRLPNCSGCRFNLRDVRRADGPRPHRSTTSPDRGEVIYEFKLEALGKLHPEEQYSVHLREIEKGRWAVVKTLRTSSDLAAEHDFSDFASLDGFLYPRSMVLQATDTSGQGSVVEYRIVSVGRPESSFAYRVPAIDKVMNGDTGQIIPGSEVGN